MDEQKVTVTKQEVEDIMKVVLEEAKAQGYQEAAKAYVKANSVIWKRGFIVGSILSTVALVGGYVGKKKYDEKKAKEEKEKEPYNVDDVEVS